MARFIIGFDIGHGQCSVAKMDIQGNGNPEDLNIKPGIRGKLINSQMLKGVNGWILEPIDDDIKDAIKNLRQINSEESLIFEDSIKEPIPLKETGKKQDICKKIKFFLLSLFKQIDLTYQPGIILNPDYVLYFACPSAWNDEQVEAYETVIFEALSEYLEENGERKKTVKVIRESDAAYIASRKNWGEYNLPDNPHVLIIDFGSSTIDFTWYGDSDLVHDGDKNKVGASKVEEILFYYMKHYEKMAHSAFDEMKQRIGENNAKKIITTRLRGKKELFFSTYPRGRFYGYDFREAVAGLNTPFFTCDEPYPADKINEILSCNDEYLNVENFDGRNYMGQVKEAFEEFKKSDKMHGRQIDAIIITGGASRMPFVETIAHEVFNKPIIKDQDHDRDFVVSRGTAIWGRYHYLASPKIEQINKKLAEDWGIILDNTLMCEGNNDDVFSIKIGDNLVHEWGKKLLNLTQDTYKEYITTILSSWTNDDAYSYTEGRNLKAVLEPLRVEKNTQSWRNLFDDLNKDESMLVGRRSIHSLLRNIYDCIDGNNELLSNINATLKSKLEENVDSNILPLLEKYYKVYFGQEAELPKRFLDPITNAKVDAGISISFTDAKKKNFSQN